MQVLTWNHPSNKRNECNNHNTPIPVWTSLSPLCLQPTARLSLSAFCNYYLAHFSRVSCKWSNTVSTFCVCLCFTYFTQCNYFQILSICLLYQLLLFSCQVSIWLLQSHGSSVHRIFQARILEWVAISSSRGSSQPGTEPVSLVSPALTGGFFTTRTTLDFGKSKICIYLHIKTY